MVHSLECKRQSFFSLSERKQWSICHFSLLHITYLHPKWNYSIPLLGLLSWKILPESKYLTDSIFSESALKLNLNKCFNLIFFSIFVSPLFPNFNWQLNNFSKDFNWFNEYGLFIPIVVLRGILRGCWRGREKSMASHLWPSRFWRKPTSVVASVWLPPSWPRAITPFCSASRSDPLRCLIRLISMKYLHSVEFLTSFHVFKEWFLKIFFLSVLNFTFRFFVFVGYYFFNLLTYYLLFLVSKHIIALFAGYHSLVVLKTLMCKYSYWLYMACLFPGEYNMHKILIDTQM